MTVALVVGLRDRILLDKHFTATHVIVIAAQIFLVMPGLGTPAGAPSPGLFPALINRRVLMLLLAHNEGVVRR